MFTIEVKLKHIRNNLDFSEIDEALIVGIRIDTSCTNIKAELVGGLWIELHHMDVRHF